MLPIQSEIAFKYSGSSSLSNARPFSDSPGITSKNKINRNWAVKSWVPSKMVQLIGTNIILCVPQLCDQYTV